MLSNQTTLIKVEQSLDHQAICNLPNGISAVVVDLKNFRWPQYAGCEDVDVKEPIKVNIY